MLCYIDQGRDKATCDATQSSRFLVALPTYLSPQPGLTQLVDSIRAMGTESVNSYFLRGAKLCLKEPFAISVFAETWPRKKCPLLSPL